MSWALDRSCAAANRTEGTSFRMARRSSQVSVGIEPKPPRAPPDCVLPDITISRFEPIDANDASTSALAPSPMATIAMTAPTPMMMPSTVRNERILLRSSARSATRKVSSGITRRPPCAVVFDGRRGRQVDGRASRASGACRCGRGRRA